tara:strand:+ start:566 stop:763 length:198 start_codon:yes stop_codon:yes gene_type:complete
MAKRPTPTETVVLALRVPQYLKEAVEIYCREFNKQPGNLGARMSPSGLGRAIITDWLRKQGVQDI